MVAAHRAFGDDAPSLCGAPLNPRRTAPPRSGRAAEITAVAGAATAAEPESPPEEGRRRLAPFPFLPAAEGRDEADRDDDDDEEEEEDDDEEEEKRWVHDDEGGGMAGEPPDAESRPE